MTTPLKFFAASDGVAMSVDSLTTLLDNDLQLLTYVVKFNEKSKRNFALGFSNLSPMETFDRDDVNDAVSFLELDPDEPEELMPPYAKGTLMYVNIWRNDVNHVYMGIKIGERRSGTYAFSVKAHHDFFVVRCKPAYVIGGGLIDFMTTKEYLKGLDDGEEKGAICIICQEKQATVYYDECGHVLYCDDCVEQAVSRNEKCCYCAPDIPNRDMPCSLDPYNKIGKKAMYCVNCSLDVNGKRCTKVQALGFPCRHVASCIESVQVGSPCPLCDTIIVEFKQVFC